MRSPGKDQPARIEAKCGEAVAVRMAVIAQPVGRQNKEDRVTIYLLPFPLGGRVGRGVAR